MIKHIIKVTSDGEMPREILAERIELDYPGLQGRGEACMGMTSDGAVWAAVGFNVPRLDPGSPASLERLFRSTDGGQTWTSQPLPMTEWGRLLAFTTLSDDTLLLAVSGLDRLLAPHINVYRSTDRGDTWHGPARISAAPYRDIGGGFVSMTQLTSGTVLLPVSRRTDDAGGHRSQDLIFRSTDGGETWGDPQPTFDYVGEAHVIQLHSGKALGAFRLQRSVLENDPADFVEKWSRGAGQGGSSGSTPEGPLFKRVFIGRSGDGGRNWTGLRPLETEDGTSVLEFGECHGQLLQVPDGRVVLVHDRRYPYECSEIRARISHDDGLTWGSEVYHLTDGMGYPASVVLEDGTIVTVTGCTRTDDRAEPLGPWSVAALRWRLPAIISK